MNHHFKNGCGKLCYVSQAKARKALKRYSALDVKRHYVCKKCGYFHLTSQREVRP
jgi:rubrerythrin